VKTLIIGSSTHVGRVRADNQDFFGKFPGDSLDLSAPKGQLFIVADGMGGHKAGRMASELAVNTLSKTYFSSTSVDILESLRAAFQAANTEIFTYGSNNPGFTGMGTTCCALVLRDGRAFIGHIGDSRIYQITKRRITQLTQDHSKVAEMVRRGIITKEEARTHPERSHLYRALGTRPTLEADFFDDIPLTRTKSFLMCTDGLYNHIEEWELHQTVLSHAPQEACTLLVDMANDRGGQDNITVQIIQLVIAGGRLRRLLRGNGSDAGSGRKR
jgi:protein phosphatase